MFIVKWKQPVSIHPQLKVILLSLGKCILSKFLWSLGNLVPCGISGTTLLAKQCKLHQVFRHTMFAFRYFTIPLSPILLVRPTKIQFPFLQGKWWKWQWCPLLAMLSTWMLLYCKHCAFVLKQRSQFLC